jgi:hypothetical protein
MGTRSSARIGQQAAGRLPAADRLQPAARIEQLASRRSGLDRCDVARGGTRAQQDCSAANAITRRAPRRARGGVGGSEQDLLGKNRASTICERIRRDVRPGRRPRAAGRRARAASLR